MADRGTRLPLLHLVPNLVTILGLCAGLTALRFAFDGHFQEAAGLVVFAASSSTRWPTSSTSAWRRR